jgi:hypothetical protein
MKSRIICFFVWISVAGLVWAGEMIPEENQTILENQNHEMGPRSRWIPTRAQTSGALEAIYAFLSKAMSPDWKNRNRLIIRNRFSTYHVQFVGIMVDGRRALHCNFFPADDDIQHDTDSYVYVLDGGASYWRINYDTQEDQCFDFDVNGES